MATACSLPLTMATGKIPLVLGGEDSAKFGRAAELWLVILTLQTKLAGHIHQVARRSKLAGHCPGV